MDNQDLMHKWSGYLVMGVIVTIIDYFIMMNQKDASTGAKITAIILLIGIVFCIVCIVKINVYNAKVKNMSANEYIVDRFASMVSEAKEDDEITVKCPYCQSTNTKKISNVSKAKMFKQWHCNNCNSDF